MALYIGPAGPAWTCDCSGPAQGERERLRQRRLTLARLSAAGPRRRQRGKFVTVVQSLLIEHQEGRRGEQREGLGAEHREEQREGLGAEHREGLRGGIGDDLRGEHVRGAPPA
jgi:hypothetical protein